MDFVMIAVALTVGASAPSAGTPSSQALAQRHFADQTSCEQAAGTAVPPLGIKLVCVPAGTGGLFHTAH